MLEVFFHSYFPREKSKLAIRRYNRRNLSYQLLLPSPYLGVSRTGVQLQGQDMLLWGCANWVSGEKENLVASWNDVS